MSGESGLVRRALLAFGASGAALASDTAGAAANDLSRAIAAYDAATIRKDIVALAEIVMDDYILVNSDASVQDKQSYLADFNLPGFTIEPYEMQEPLFRVWGDAALSGGRMHLAWMQDGARHRRWLRVGHVWVRRKGRWRIAYTQMTRISDN